MTTSIQLQPPAGSTEPMLSGWQEITAKALLADLTLPETGRTHVVAVDGRSGSGKTTLATRLLAVTRNSALVSTDDIAWHHSMFDWADLLAEHVLAPARAGSPVDYRPPGWIAKNRPGSIQLPGELSVLIVEGVGASRLAFHDQLDAAIWVQSDAAAARDAGLARDIATGVNGDAAGAAAFWDLWQAEEFPFLEEDQPWTRATASVAGVGRDTAELGASYVDEMIAAISGTRMINSNAANTAIMPTAPGRG